MLLNQQFYAFHSMLIHTLAKLAIFLGLGTKLQSRMTVRPHHWISVICSCLRYSSFSCTNSHGSQGSITERPVSRACKERGRGWQVGGRADRRSIPLAALYLTLE